MTRRIISLLGTSYRISLIGILFAGAISCTRSDSYRNAFPEGQPGNDPIPFMEELTPANTLIHKGIFSPDLNAYYYTLSDAGFAQFDVYVIRKQGGEWSAPEKAFFNSEFSDHGMSFSPDGSALYFSSTRPTKIDSIPKTWHIWKSTKTDVGWSKPEFVDIPNLRSKLVSHPTITRSGNLYFHASNLDYSEMDIYYSKRMDGAFTDAKSIKIPSDSTVAKCTPYISPDEDFLIFAAIGLGDQLQLAISYNDGKDNWTNMELLNEKINAQGQGNPFVTPDNEFLFFTTGSPSGSDWKVKWVSFKSVLEN